jgi:hypothetical protein
MTECRQSKSSTGQRRNGCPAQFEDKMDRGGGYVCRLGVKCGYFGLISPNFLMYQFDAAIFLPFPVKK